MEEGEGGRKAGEREEVEEGDDVFMPLSDHLASEPKGASKPLVPVERQQLLQQQQKLQALGTSMDELVAAHAACKPGDLFSPHAACKPGDPFSPFLLR